MGGQETGDRNKGDMMDGLLGWVTILVLLCRMCHWNMGPRLVVLKHSLVNVVWRVDQMVGCGLDECW